ncbi:PREDICTED: interferon-inducible GTPase 5-like [Gavialis gangeticus]|uniref:interferon-inducible GTPase 5-like n=1 Tax=Gavialis gangeticus TaxID=94835 RepID=UPI00092E53BF|nr:PREDICTED: interferon-inducible GTPase 5-like [Gavialis gangeticus]
MAGAGENLDPEAFSSILPELQEELKAALQGGDLVAAASKAQEVLCSVDKVVLNIAITGITGSGKSSFVNAMRGVEDGDKDAAAIGVTETTSKPACFPHPQYPNVIFWDLPGIGTQTFQADAYLQQMLFDRYDFFIIISGPRFRENDIKLAREIQRLGKCFYFVRSKVDQDLCSEQRLYDQSGCLKKPCASRPPQYDEADILNKIREDCMGNLQKGRVDFQQVFLVSNWYTSKYDFPRLQETLAHELPSHKRLAFLRSLPNLSKETVEEKKTCLMTQVWLKSLASLGAGALPVPGFSTVCDVVLLVSTLKQYCQDFGLDKESLDKIASLANKPVKELTDVIKSPLAHEITKDLVIKLLSKTVGGGVKYTLFFKNILPLVGPVIGSVVSGTISYIATYTLLKGFLNAVADDALSVLEKALG